MGLRKSFMALFLFQLINVANAQEQYMTLKGIMELIIEERDTMKSVEIHNVIVMLDYDRAVVQIGFHPGDTIRSLFPNHEFSLDEKISIYQDLSLSEIETRAHPDWSFTSEGYLRFENEKFELQGIGKLVHYHGSSTVTCRLDITMKGLKNGGIFLSPFGLITEIRLIQNVLNRKIMEGQSISDGH